MGNQHLNKVRETPRDELYTLLSDIEKEVSNYDLKGKVVYCNCDGSKSAFYRFFVAHYHELGLAGLIVSEYVSQQMDIFREEPMPAKYVLYDGRTMITRYLEGDGDFRSAG